MQRARASRCSSDASAGSSAADCFARCVAKGMRSNKLEPGGGGAGTRRLRSLSSRVALVALTSAALGGLAASVVAILAVDRLIGDQADQRLRAATITLAGELDEDRDDKKQEPVGDVV